MVPRVAEFDPLAARVVAVEEDGGQIVVHHLHLQPEPLDRLQSDLGGDLLPVGIDRQQSIGQPVVVEQVRVGDAQQQVQAGLFHPGRHVGQGAGRQQAVDHQDGEDDTFRQPALARAAPVHRRRQADPFHVGQHQVQAANLVSDLRHAALLEGGQGLYFGGGGLWNGFYLGRTGRHYSRLGQVRRVLPGPHPPDETLGRVHHGPLPTASAPEGRRRPLLGWREPLAYPGQACVELGQVWAEVVLAQDPAWVQLLQGHGSPENAIGAVEEQHAAGGSGVGHMEHQALAALQVEDDDVLKHRHARQPRGIGRRELVQLGRASQHRPGNVAENHVDVIAAERILAHTGSQILWGMLCCHHQRSSVEW